MTAGNDEPAPPATPPSPRPSLRQRFAAQTKEYGRVAIITYFTLSILAIIGFSIAIGLGVEPSSATGMFGVIFAGWALAKATLPIRLLLTLGLTPVIAFLVTRRRATQAPPVPVDDPPAPDADVP
ncbi:MAG: hypothetical protein E6J90_46935 [Deltaproteobacteria bacterium]|nr:MAG: hypothetical protein E6J90_46935 [Deltaproteobacteria bacterium]